MSIVTKSVKINLKTLIENPTTQRWQMAHKTLYVGSYPYSTAIDEETVKQMDQQGQVKYGKQRPR